MTTNGKRGKFITCDGFDGAGKSTNCKHLVEILKSYGYSVIHTREPGGTPVAEEMRELNLKKREGVEQIVPLAELLMFAAARAQLIETLIKPALNNGICVVCDRFTDSTFAYQAIGRGQYDAAIALEQMVCNGFEPDYTLFFEISLEEAEKRLAGRQDKVDRFDEEAKAFKQRVFKGFEMRKSMIKHRLHLIDAMPGPEQVKMNVEEWVREVFVPQNPLA